MGIMRDINPKTGPVGGVIAQVSSAGGYVGVAGLSPYSASKFALEGFTEAVSKEPDSAWNIRFAIFEPGSVKTQWSGGNMDRESKQHEAYVGKGLATDTIKDMRTAFEEKTGADPDIVSDLMVAVLKGEKGNWDGRDLLRLPITASGFAVVRTEAARQLRLFDEWKDISESVSSVEVIETLKGLGMLKE